MRLGSFQLYMLLVGSLCGSSAPQTRRGRCPLLVCVLFMSDMALKLTAGLLWWRLRACCSTGGVLMNLRTAKRQWVRSADTDGSFFVDTSAHAQQLGLLQGPSKLAAGLSDVEAVAAASNGRSSSSSHNGVLAGLGSPERIAAAISSADAEMQAHIAAQSLSVDIQQGSTAGSKAGGSLSSRSRAKTPDLSQKELLKFVRDFEPLPVPAEDMLWGLQGDVARHRCAEQQTQQCRRAKQPAWPLVQVTRCLCTGHHPAGPGGTAHAALCCWSLPVSRQCIG